MTRALVLGGGGPVGIGWQVGLAAGLAAEGVDLAAADCIVGTSAGSVVGSKRAADGSFELVEPGEEFLEISGMGMFLMDASRSRAAFDAGVRQGATEAPRLRDLWSD